MTDVSVEGGGTGGAGSRQSRGVDRTLPVEVMDLETGSIEHESSVTSGLDWFRCVRGSPARGANISHPV